MIKIYYSPSCSSCRKVLQWFDEEKIPYQKKDIFSKKMTRADIIEILIKAENGTDDIISPRSKIVQEGNIDFDSMKISELVTFILENPSILRRPIIVDDHRVQVGYNEEEITVFLPRIKKLARSACTVSDCPIYQVCEAKNESAS